MRLVCSNCGVDFTGVEPPQVEDGGIDDTKKCTICKSGYLVDSTGHSDVIDPRLVVVLDRGRLTRPI